MKNALLLITIPYALALLAGMFEWYMDDGVWMLFGISMLVGIIWGWIVELKK